MVLEIKFNMNFLDEIGTKLGFERKLLRGGFKFFCFSFNSVLIEGHRNISKFSPTEMEFGVKNGKILIIGENLTIKNFSKFSVLVEGKVKETKFLGKGVVLKNED